MALDSGGYRGREGVERFAADTSENWVELQSIAEEFRDLGDRVLVLGRMKGRAKGGGVPVDQPFATDCTALVPAPAPNAATQIPILRAALACGADYLITNDKHLLELNPYEGLAIVSMDRYLQILDERGLLD